MTFRGMLAYYAMIKPTDALVQVAIFISIVAAFSQVMLGQRYRLRVLTLVPMLIPLFARRFIAQFLRALEPKLLEMRLVTADYSFENGWLVDCALVAPLLAIGLCSALQMAIKISGRVTEKGIDDKKDE